MTTSSTPTAEQERMVLRELWTAGSRGVHSHELARRLPILNVPERIRRLRKAGWRIDSTRERSPYGGKSWGTRYRLAGHASASDGDAAPRELGRRPRPEQSTAAPIAAESPRAA